MLRRLLSASLIATFTLAALPASARPDDDRRGEQENRQDRRGERGNRENGEDRKYWKERDKAEREYWKERDKEGRNYERHRYDDHDRGDDRDHDRGRGGHHRAPAWMDGYWRPGDQSRYVALVPGDPSRIYVFLEGRWILRQVRDPRARLDLEGAFRLPMAPPPVAPPRIGLDLHVVLFN